MMKDILKGTMAILAMAAEGESAYLPVEEYKRNENNKYNLAFHNKNYREKSVRRDLREFVIGSERIMAYSKKDAIKRLKHGHKRT